MRTAPLIIFTLINLVVVNILALALYYHSSTQFVAYHILVTLLVISVMNSMACKVYRDIKFGRISGTSPAVSINVRAIRDSNLPRTTGDGVANESTHNP